MQGIAHAISHSFSSSLCTKFFGQWTMLEIWKNLPLSPDLLFGGCAQKDGRDATFFFFGENFATVTKVIESIESGRRGGSRQTETSQVPLRIFPSKKRSIRHSEEKRKRKYCLEFQFLNKFNFGSLVKGSHFFSSLCRGFLKPRMRCSVNRFGAWFKARERRAAAMRNSLNPGDQAR